MTIRNVNPPRKRRCPQCDNLGFKRVSDNWTRGTVLQCNYCGHEWERQGHVNVSDKREIIVHPYEEA